MLLRTSGITGMAGEMFNHKANNSILRLISSCQEGQNYPHLAATRSLRTRCIG